MENAVIDLLILTQSSQEAPRRQAEQQLKDLYSNESFPHTLYSIASHSSIALATRQSALLTLKNFVLTSWSPSFEEFEGQILINDANKSQLRTSLLDLATSDAVERKVQNAASYVVSKIASVDYPDDWPDLLPTLMQLLTEAGDARLHGALKILYELIEDGFNEDQFFKIARDLVNVLYSVSVNESKPPALRALAVSVFRGCFDILEMVLEDHKSEVKTFAEQTVSGWMSFFLDVLQGKLSPKPTANEESQTIEHYHGSVALKLQVVKVLMRIRVLFPAIISPQSQALFSATWEELSALLPEYQATYVLDDQEGRLEDSDGLPYTLDFLALEYLDFMQACIRAPPVRKALESELQTQTQSNWMTDVMKLAASYSQITTEEEGMWQIDVNVFLSEETSATANYTARTACGDLVIKLGEWLPDASIAGLLAYVQTLYQTDTAWKLKESSLYLLDQILGDWHSTGRQADPSISESFYDIVQNAVAVNGFGFLRARGFLVAGALAKGSQQSFHSKAALLLDRTLQSITDDPDEIVQVSCIRAITSYLESLAPEHTLPLQSSIVAKLSTWLSSQDLNELTESDDLMITLLETLRDTLLLDTHICIAGDGLNLLFSVASQGASNFQVSTLVTEMFEEICVRTQEIGSEAYAQLCQRVLPSLTGAFDVGDLKEENALINLAAELLSSLAQNSPPPLPESFIPTILPKLLRITLNSTDSELLKSCTSTLRYVVSHSPTQLFQWIDPTPPPSPTSSKSGLEAILTVIDRLLNPSLVEDNAAAEVGYLAAEVVEKGGTAQLGAFMMQQLLQAVAQRLASAEQAALIQSLILVFGRLSLTNASEVVEFLSTLAIASPNSAQNSTQFQQARSSSSSGLQIVLGKWLDNTSDFAGYDSIRLNILALAKLYELHDPRLTQITVKGDIIVDQSNSGRIVTRSRAKQMPERWEMVSVPVKIVKILVEELAMQMQTAQSAVASATGGFAANGSSANGATGSFTHTAESDEDEDSDGEWEDEPGAGLNVLDLGLGATKAELMSWGGEEGEFRLRQPDDETQTFLQEFFRMQAADERFAAVFEQLNDGEKVKLRSLT